MIKVEEKCEHLLNDYSELLERHLYLKESLTRIHTKIYSLSTEPAPNHEAIAKQEQSKLDIIHERIKTLLNDPWLDQLFSHAQNEQQVEEIKRLMRRWAKSSYDSIAHCIVDHASRHGFSRNELKYLRKAGHFSKKRARKAYPELGVVRWNKGNNEYLIEREGKIVSYCINC